MTACLGNGKNFITALTDTFCGQFTKTYKFFSIAVDKAGNFKKAPFGPYLNPDGKLLYRFPLPIFLLNFEVRKTSDKKKVELH